MSDELGYPYNLFAAMQENTKLVLPQTLTADVLAGLQYVLSTLPAENQALIQLRFAEKKTLLETATRLSHPMEEMESFEKAALKRLCTPSAGIISGMESPVGRRKLPQCSMPGNIV